MNPYLSNIRTVRDQRGNLSIVSGSQDVPFPIERIFYIWNNSDNHPRGGHAHKECWQAMIAVHGTCIVCINDGVESHEFDLNLPDSCVIVPPGHWADLINFSKDCVLLVLASHEYNEIDYIRNYEEYLRYVQQKI